MKQLAYRGFLLVICLAFALLRLNVGAQQTPPTKPAALIPIVPLLIEYEYAPLHLMQWINDHPEYTMIEAIINQGETPLYQVILTEKESRQRVYYCNAEAKVNALAREGREAHLTAIDFKTAANAEGPQSYGVALSDKRGQPVRWRFLPASVPSQRGAGLTPLANVPGLRLEYRDLGTTAGAGTAVQIGNKLCEAAPWPEISAPPYFVAYRGSLALGRHLSALPLGKESWQITAAPAELREGAEWRLLNEHGRERVLRLTARQGEWLTINEVGATDAQSSTLSLQARFTDGGLTMLSARFVSGSQTMRLSFKSELNLFSGKSAETAFQIDLGKTERVVQGIATLDKQGEALQLRWQPKAPDWAKGRALEATIKLAATGYTIETVQAAK